MQFLTISKLFWDFSQLQSVHGKCLLKNLVQSATLPFRRNWSSKNQIQNWGKKRLLHFNGDLSNDGNNKNQIFLQGGEFKRDEDKEREIGNRNRKESEWEGNNREGEREKKKKEGEK